MTLPSDDLLLAWYADDYTGAAAVLEVLAFAGINAMLFLDVPSKAQLSRFSNLQAIGIASTARAQSPNWMKHQLPPVFKSLLAMEPNLFHYKTCSTLDSSPFAGSIGRAIEIGADLVNPESVPILVAAPQMRRYQAFGHLFAALGSDTYRLDRHPVMARHPVTPMTESDVARHIKAQSSRLEIGLWSLEDMAASRQPSPAKQETDRISAFTIDCMDSRSEAAAGRLLWNQRKTSRFVVGSQGIEYALLRHWVEAGLLPEQSPPGCAGVSKGMITVSGSVSPTTAEQISWSRHNGFTTIRFDVLKTCGSANDLENEILRVVTDCLSVIESNANPLVFTAEGPDDPIVDQLRQLVSATNQEMAEINKRIGMALGNALFQILSLSNIRRAVVSGGDTSGYVSQQLGIFALSALAPTIPGASLSKAHAEGPMDELELALKGGQMGSPDYFGWIRDGGGLR